MTIRQKKPDPVQGGYIVLARAFFQSDLWVNKPGWWTLVWIYLIQSANWCDGKQLKRGQLFTTFDDIYKACKLKDFGVKQKSLTNVTRKLRMGGLITSRKTPRGIVITICNYDRYQSIGNYENATEKASQNATEKPTESQPKATITKDIKTLRHKEDIYTVFKFWNEQGIIRHRKMESRMVTAIKTKLDLFTITDITEAIKNYAQILKGEDYYWTYRWAVDEFLTRSGGFEKFRTENDPFTNFKKQEDETTQHGFQTGAIVN